MGRIDPEVDLAKLRESPNHESSSNQEHHGKCDFRDHQRAAKPSAPWTLQRAAARLLQRFREMGLGALQRGRQAKEESRRQYGDQSEGKNPQVSCAARQAWSGVQQKRRASAT